MCGRYQLNFDDPEKFKQRFDIEGDFPVSEIQTSYNVTPEQTLPVVVTHSPNSVELMRWGLIPFWEKSEKPRGLINVRDDTAIEKKWAHKYLETQRCIVPASGFYEWKKTPDGKVPFRIFLKDDDYIAFAGIYSIWTHPKTGKDIKSFAIITTSPNDLMESIHNRMPVILDKEQESEWLNPGMVEIEKIGKFLKPYKSNKMSAYAISARVNSPYNNDEDIIKEEKKQKPQ